MSSSSSNSKKGAKGAMEHPFASKEPKPTRARLVSLLDPLGRKRYGEVERFLATVDSASSGLFYYENGWGWAVRYMLGPKETLCTLHLLPNLFEATVGLSAETNGIEEWSALTPEMRRRLARVRPTAGARLVRMPIRGDTDFTSFQTWIKLKVGLVRAQDALKSKNKAKATKPAAEAKK